LYDWLLKNGYADAMLIAKWKKTGYEKVCLLLFAPSIIFRKDFNEVMLTSKI
jgi:hypothetical protein